MFSDLSFEILCFADLVCLFCIPPNQIGDLQIVAKIIIYAIQAIFKSPIPKLLMAISKNCFASDLRIFTRKISSFF